MISVRRKKHLDVKMPNGPKRVKVGFPLGKSEGDIVDRAVWNHYGTDGNGNNNAIPPRPFILNATTQNKRKYLRALRISVPKIVSGETDLKTVLSKLGILAQGDIQSEITELRDPPNAESTIRAKGSSNPLIDTGEMRQKVTWTVSDD